MGFFDLHPFNKLFRLIFKTDTKTKLRVQPGCSRLNLSGPQDEIKLKITIYCLLSIILSQTVDTRLIVHTGNPPRLSINIVEAATGSEEVVYNFVTADMKYIITADGKIFYIKS